MGIHAGSCTQLVRGFRTLALRLSTPAAVASCPLEMSYLFLSYERERECERE